MRCLKNIPYLFSSLYNNLLVEEEFQLQVPRQPGHTNFTLLNTPDRLGYTLTARTRDQVAPVYTRVLQSISTYVSSLRTILLIPSCVSDNIRFIGYGGHTAQ